MDTIKKVLFQQQDLFDRAVSLINSGPKRLAIIGPAGCGKTMLTNYIYTKLINTNKPQVETAVIHLQGDIQFSTRDYYPFTIGSKNGIDHMSLGKS